MSSWLSRNWRKAALIVAGAVAALTAEHTIAHRAADAVSKALNPPAVTAPAQP